MKFRHNIPAEWRGRKILFKVDPDPTNTSALVDSDDGIIWFHPGLWQCLCQIDDIIINVQEQSVTKGGTDA